MCHVSCVICPQTPRPARALLTCQRPSSRVRQLRRQQLPLRFRDQQRSHQPTTPPDLTFAVQCLASHEYKHAYMNTYTHT
jgi:hypothetical protein